MNRWIHLIGALALVLLLWTSGTARAADQYMQVPVAAEITGHFAGDKDEVPSDNHKSAPHHHLSCGEHATAAWRTDPATVTFLLGREQASALARCPPEGREPDNDLRPPIA